MHHKNTTDKNSTYGLIIKFIRDNYQKKNFKVTDMALLLNISLSTLQRKLKAEKHITLNQLLYQY